MAFVASFIPTARPTVSSSTNVRPLPSILPRTSFAGAQCTVLHHARPRAFAATNEKKGGAGYCVMNISTNDFRIGTTIEMEGTPYRVIEFLHVKPGKGAAFVRSKLKNLKTGNNLEKTFKAGEMVTSAQLDKFTMQHTYVDGEEFVFMNMESFDEERMTGDALGEWILKFLTVGLEVDVLKHNERVIGINLPKVLSFNIESTEPGAKGNTAQGNVLKPAIIETGAEVMVPLFINSGEQVRINTEDAKYVGRDKD